MPSRIFWTERGTKLPQWRKDGGIAGERPKLTHEQIERQGISDASMWALTYEDPWLQEH